MGDLSRKFCDGCKSEFVPATYSQGTESGRVSMSMAVWKATGSTVEGIQLELCTACHDKFIAWADTKKTAADMAWLVPVPSPTTVTPPSL